METTFKTVIQRLRIERTHMTRTIICCQSQGKCAQLYLLMKILLRVERVKPIGAPDFPEFRLFDMLLACYGFLPFPVLLGALHRKLN